MSHQAGLPGLTGEAGKLHISDHEGVAAALAAQEPLWKPGAAHGYHARTIGFLVDECLRRATGGTPLSRYWRELFAEPLRLDTWIGLPEERDAAVAEIIPPRYATSTDPEDPYYRALADGQSLTRLAFATPNGYRASEMNAPEARRVPIASWGGYSTAISLAKFYALLAGDGTWDGRRYFTETTLEWMRTPLVDGPDETLKKPTSFAAGFMLDPIDPATGGKLRQLFGPNPRAFGHPGAGGGTAFADPVARLSFAYVMNQMEFGVFPGEKSLGLVERLYENRSD
jgi:CubicO group peptidase (beta-lactamase class C family)